MKNFTTRTALLFSAISIIIFTIIMIIIFCIYQMVPDVLIGAFFSAFSIEGGYCAFIHKLKKDSEKSEEEEVEDL